MAKKKTPKKEETKVLETPEQVAHAKIPDPGDQLREVMGFGLESAYKLGVEADNKGNNNVAKTTHVDTKAANVDALPQIKK